MLMISVYTVVKWKLHYGMSQLKQTKLNKHEGEQEQTKFAIPDEQSMVQLQNMPQKTNN